MLDVFQKYCELKKTKTDIEDLQKKADFILMTRDEARSVLMWSYPYAYMLKDGSVALRLFEFVQKECETAIERLCYAIEGKKVCVPDRLMAMGKILARNTEVLLKHVDQDS
jgi:uncharacterized protein with PIN domain